MNEQTVRLLLRIPASLKTKLAELAVREHRSLNRQIEFMLDRAIREKTDIETKRSARSRSEDRNNLSKEFSLTEFLHVNWDRLDLARLLERLRKKVHSHSWKWIKSYGTLTV